MKNTTNKKQTKKVIKPVYVVDLTNAQGEFDATLRFALCKYDNKICNFTRSDVFAIKQYIKLLSLPYVIEELINHDELFLIGCGAFCKVGPIKSMFFQTINIKKPNIFKRFWNWLTHKK